MKITGKILKDNREKQNITLSEVSSSTKINTKVLQAIEEGDLEKLPSMSFLKGFLRTYSKFLKLDPKHVLQTFEEEMGIAQIEQNLVAEDQPTDIEPPKPKVHREFKIKLPDFITNLNYKSITSKSLVAAGIVILIVLIVSMKNVVEKYENETKLPDNELIVSTLDNKEKSGEIDLGPNENKVVEERPVISVDAEEPKEELVEEKEEPKEELVEEKEEPKEEVVEKKEEPKEEVVEKKEEPKEEVVEKKEEPKEEVAEEKEEPKVEVAQDAEDDEEVDRKPLPKFQHELIVEALDSIDLEYSIDDGSDIDSKLTANQIQIIKAFKEIDIRISDAGSANIIYNGRELGVAGELGKSSKLRFPKR